MKKLVVAITLGVATCLSSFAQGNFTFSNNSSTSVYVTSGEGVWAKAGATLSVALLWSASTAAIPANYLNGAATPNTGDYNASWAGILDDPNFQLARNTTVGNPVHILTAGGGGPAAGSYNGGLRYIDGTSAGDFIALYVIAWERIYATPQEAAAANGDVGFSQKIVYELGSVTAPKGSLGPAGIGLFGVAPVPEPTSFALAGLGAAALLIFRRRK